MKVSVQVIVHPDDDTEASSVVREVLTLDRDGLAPDTLGLQLAEAKDLLTAVQDTVVEQQVNDAIAKQVACPHCGAPRRHKDTRTIVVRSLFGALRLPSPRWWHCCCQDQPTRTFQPLAELLPERTTPELAYLQARFAGLVSYGITAELLGELLPLGRKLHPAVVRRQTQAVAPCGWRANSARSGSVSSTPASATVRNYPARTCRSSSGWTAATSTPAEQRSRTDGWFEVIAGKAIPAEGRPSLLRVRADLRHQTETPPVRGAQIPWDAGQPAGHLPHRRRRRHPRPAGGRGFAARKGLVIATGTEPAIPSIDGLSGVGLTEAATRAGGLDVRVGLLPTSSSDRGWLPGPGADLGVTKVVAGAAAGVLVGGSVMGPASGEVAAFLARAIRARIPVGLLMEVIYPYPTFTRGVRGALRRLG